MKNRLDDYDQYKHLECEFNDIQMLNGFVLVEVDLNLTTQSGLIIPFGGSLTESYNREGHCVRRGVVKSFSNECMYGRDNNQSLWKNEVEIEVGDEVYFDFISSIDSVKMLNDGKLYYVLPYHSLYVAKRKIDSWKTEIIMLNGYLLCTELDNYTGFFTTIYKDKKNPIVEVKYAGSKNETYLDGEGYDDDINVGDKVEVFHYTMIKLEDENHLSFNGDEKYIVLQRRRCIFKH